MKKQWIIALCVMATLGLTASLIWGRVAEVAQVNTASVQFGDFSVAIDVQGEVRASDEYAVMPGMSGRVKEVFVREGQQVKKGQKLFQIDDKDAQSLLQQARYELQLAQDAQDTQNEQTRLQAQAQAEARAAQEEVREAAAQAQLQGMRQAAEEALSMAQNMGIDYHTLNRALTGQMATDAASGAAAGPEELAEMAEMAEMMESQDAQSEQEAEAKTDPRVQLARERVKQAENAVAQHAMVCDTDGTVLRVNIRAGEIVPAGMQVMVIGETQKPIIVAQVGERDLARVAIGQRTHMTVDSKTYSGRVVRVSPAAMRTAMTQQASGEVEIQPDTGFSALVGASVEMSVVVAHSSNTCRVPQECVVEEDGEYYVFVVRDDVAWKRAVTPGLRDDFNVEIVDGLVMGEHVVLLPAGIVDGTRVHATQ